MLWIVGYNMPGYLPEMEPYQNDTWEDAREALRQELDGAAEAAAEAGDANEVGQLEAALTEVANLKDGTPYGRTIGKFHYWMDREDG